MLVWLAMFPARHIGIAASLCAVALALAKDAPALAAEPGAWVLAGSAGYTQARARISNGDSNGDGARWTPGLRLAAEGLYGLDEAWSLRMSLAAGWQFAAAEGSRPGGTVRTLSGGAGVVYAVDVLRVVPFVEAGLALAHASRPLRDPGAFLGLEVGGGAAYLVDRRWSLSGILRLHHLGVRLGGGPGPASSPLVLALGLRLERLL
jgi:hypothetical protein